jgi:hypothetical protein
MALACIVVATTTAAWWWDARGGGLGCHDDEGSRPVSPASLVVLAITLGLPCACIVGPIVGALAAQIRHVRRIVLASIAIAAASIVPALASTSCDAARVMWYQAATPALLAALVLERATRREPSVPVATSRRS